MPSAGKWQSSVHGQSGGGALGGEGGEDGGGGAARKRPTTLALQGANTTRLPTVVAPENLSVDVVRLPIETDASNVLVAA
eukprot:6900081-Prymnesium_polylepis.1